MSDHLTPYRAGQLVAATSTPARRVHASRLLVPAHDPGRGLVPWWPVGGCGGPLTHVVDRPVDCRACRAWMRRRNLTIGDTPDA